MGECESTCHTLMWFQVYTNVSGQVVVKGGGAIRVCVNPNLLRKEDSVLVKYLCHRKKRKDNIVLYVFDRIFQMNNIKY